jgi:hypothetical protein
MSASFKLNDTEIFSELNQTVTAKNINVAANDTTTPSMAKAWVNFNGAFDASSLTPANQFVLGNGIRAAHNVDYIIDHGDGNYEIHFENAISDGKYCVCGSAVGDNSSISNTAQYTGHIQPRSESDTTASSVRILVSRNLSGAEADSAFNSTMVSVAIFR